MKRFVWSIALLAIGTALAAGVSAKADVIVPNANAATTASTSGLNTFIRDLNNPRTGQILISAAQLSSINIGDQIDGITWRMYTGNLAGYPLSNATWADYTINVGQGVAFGSQTTTFANNFIGSPTTVRTGPLTINQGSFPGGSAPNPNPFGPYIDFTTPYVYTGGNLLIEIRHTGSNITNTTTDFLEVALQTNPDYNVHFWSATATGAAATTGALANFTVSKLRVVPEPATLMMLVLGGLVALRRSRA